MSDLQLSVSDAAMGHVQPASAGCPLEQAARAHQETDELRKRPLDTAEPPPPGKRLRPAPVWRQETPPPSPHESSSEASEDESEDEEDEDEERGYQGSILASCLLSEKRTAFSASPESAESGYSPACELGRATYSGWYSEGGAGQRPQNQTVECDGKSYIQLGAVPARRERSQLYRYQRFTALHTTMLKLSRHRRMVDPPLRKSVLLFNTMRHIERELEQEGLTLAAAFNPHHFDSGPLTLDPPPPPQTPPPPAAVSLPPAPAVSASPCGDSGFGEDEINWSSVLSLGSQPELELVPLDAHTGWQLTPLSADDVLRTFPADRRDEPDAATAAAALSSLLAL
ncbi:uncharacterized protein LOC122367290 [Amphibalanus amphitrite]|uniref:uncharacterized protein LOC122367290 n=1 Tax=Amphibalanus amphitrite TaxID=1232801 RepID=UPI001C9121DD|nr:uncharacterized protein LOC122367290 [Amphibalanus amphitrite]